MDRVRTLLVLEYMQETEKRRRRCASGDEFAQDVIGNGNRKSSGGDML